MNDTINVDGKEYEQLGAVKVNNREYAFGILNNDLDYFEKTATDDNIKYVIPNRDLTLSGNAGTSLTRLNERIVMNHFADDLKKDIRNGKLRNGEDIKEEFNDIQNVIDEDPSVKKLLKGNVTDLDEDKFNERASNLIDFFDAKRRVQARKKNNIEIVDGGVDRTFANAEMYKELEKQQEADNTTMEEINKKLEEEHRDPLDSTIISPAFGMPTAQELDDQQMENDEVLEPTFIVDKLVEQEEAKEEQPVLQPIEHKDNVVEFKKPVENTLGIDESLLTPDIVSAILSDESKVARLRPEQITRLQQLRDQNINSLETEQKEESNVVNFAPEKSNTKVKTFVKKRDRKAAYVDTVILCLVTQLSIFGLLIFVLLLIK